jgi:hypothetical protein
MINEMLQLAMLRMAHQDLVIYYNIWPDLSYYIGHEVGMI